jgi:5-hydroxyisourate hydrolase
VTGCTVEAEKLRTVSKMRIVAQVLDGTYGKPAAGVPALLTRASGDDWIVVAQAETNIDGLIEDWNSWRLERGLYRITFDCDSYFAVLGGNAAYPEVMVTFRVLNETLVHVQLTLAPCSYSTYLGALDSKSSAW